MVDGWECWLKLTLMFKEVCGHLIALATVLKVLPYLRFRFLVGFEEETPNINCKEAKATTGQSQWRFNVIAPQKMFKKYMN